MGKKIPEREVNKILDSMNPEELHLPEIYEGSMRRGDRDRHRGDDSSIP